MTSFDPDMVMFSEYHFNSRTLLIRESTILSSYAPEQQYQFLYTLVKIGNFRYTVYWIVFVQAKLSFFYAKPFYNEFYSYEYLFCNSAPICLM